MKLLGAKIGSNSEIESGIRFHNCKNLRNLEIANNCHIGKDCFFDLRDRVIIENNVTVSMKTTFITHQDLGHSNLSTKYKPTSLEIIIKSNAYIGSNSIIMMGTIIDNYSIIAASSCVVKSTEPQSLFGGVPAKKIKNLSGIYKTT
ncbi:acyltransferase [Flavobacteriaceae bacterium]|nr:acyltransferase [Flavobacteriaceae bacterium]